jgi:putative colanic acid biosynthesis acetyltransferase WcaF
LVWSVFGRLSPTPLHGWRRLLLRAFGATIHATARVYPSAVIWYPKNLKMGIHAVMGPGVICYCMDKIIIEDYAVISQRAHLCGGTHRLDDPDFQLVTRPIQICRHAWVAAEAFVGPGVTIGEGAVLGARGVASRDLGSWTVFAGNPCREIRKRVNYIDGIFTTG